MSANRKRKIRVEVRMTEDEHEVFLQRMRDVGMQNMDGFLRKMALTGYILRIDMSEVRETLRLLANATNNINQIAKRANETRSIYAEDVIQLRDEVSGMRSQVSDLMKVYGKIRKLLEV